MAKRYVWTANNGISVKKAPGLSASPGAFSCLSVTGLRDTGNRFRLSRFWRNAAHQQRKKLMNEPHNGGGVETVMSEAEQSQ